MKKVFISIFMAAVTLSAFATETAKVTIRLTSTNATYGNDELELKENSDRNATYESGYDAEKMMSQANKHSVLLYAFVGDQPCSTVATDNLDGTVIGFTTNKYDTDYKLVFSNYSGRTLTLFDRVENTSITILNSVEYSFTATAGRVAVEDRFVINYEAPSYVIMNGDFTNPGASWAYTSNFTDNGTSFSLDLTLSADTWYHFQLEEGYGSAIIAADGSSFDRANTSHNIPVDGWHSALLLHTDVPGTYTFTWNDLVDNLTITFPTANTVTTNAYGFLSFAWAEDVEFFGGVKAYRGEFNSSSSELTLYEVGTKVPAGEGVILWNPNEASETFFFIDASAPAISDVNNFVGAVSAVDPAGIRAAGKEIYCLSGNQLMKYVGTDDIPAGKAYLPVSTGGAPAPKHIVMRFNGTQAIDNVEGEAVKAVKFVGEDGQILIKRGDEVFNLQGQKVNF